MILSIKALRPHRSPIGSEGTGVPYLSSACLPSSCRSSAWEEGEELLFDRISFVLFCNLNSRMEAGNVQFVLIQLYLVSPGCAIVPNVVL